jgi:ADP-heptose:LPS heptosyltransferase
MRRGVLLVSSGGLGDTILFSLVAVRFMALADEGEPVHLMVREGSEAAAFLFPPALEIIPVNYRRFIRNPFYRWSVRRRIRDFGYRVAVSTDHLRLPTVDDAMVLAAGAELTLALEPRSWPKHDRRLQKNRRRYSRWYAAGDGPAHRMVRWVDLANAIAGRADPLPRVRFPADRLPAPSPSPGAFVVVHPFSAVPERQHPPALYRRILDALPAGTPWVLSAGPGDLDRNPQFRALLEAPGATLSEAGLEDKAALMAAARLVVSVDTSALHLAVGVGAPTLCLASAAHVIDSVPYDPAMTPDNVTFLYHDMDCRGCHGACILDAEQGLYPCVARLDESRAVAAAVNIWQAGR